MTKILTGKIISLKMVDTAVVEIIRHTPHPLYKKLLRRSKKILADSKRVKGLTLGQKVTIKETAPISKRKYFKVVKEVGKK